MLKPIRVAILGATSHIAKGLIACWAPRDDRELLLYARSPEQVLKFVNCLDKRQTKVFHIDGFGSAEYDIVVNCVGLGSPLKLKENLDQIFRITTTFDDLILGYLTSRPDTLYINFSSGAAYGSAFPAPIDEQSPANFSINSLNPHEFYGIAKIHSEARHRAQPKLNIIDLRVFGYFSRYIDINDGFLLSDILSCLNQKKVFVTNPINIMRDFVNPTDLVALMDACIEHSPLNEVYDVYSGKEVSKFEILELFEEAFGLKYRIDECCLKTATTGEKSYYYPLGRKAKELGYVPSFTSAECLLAETRALIAGKTIRL